MAASQLDWEAVEVCWRVTNGRGSTVYALSDAYRVILQQPFDIPIRMFDKIKPKKIKGWYQDFKEEGTKYLCSGFWLAYSVSILALILYKEGNLKAKHLAQLMVIVQSWMAYLVKANLDSKDECIAELHNMNTAIATAFKEHGY